MAAPNNKSRPRRAGFIKVRFLIAVMATLCPVVCYISRQNLSIALGSMVQDQPASVPAVVPPVNSSVSTLDPKGNDPKDLVEPDTDVCPAPGSVVAPDGTHTSQKVPTYGPRYSWSTTQRSLIFEAFFWTYVLCQIPAARFAEIAGAKWILATAGIGSAVVSFLSPFAASIHVYLFALVRCVMGITQTALYPACYVLYTKWLPPVERSQALPILGAGAYIGSIITSTATGYFSESPTFGWEYAFYMPGVVCTIWSIIWIPLTSSEPQDHWFISQEEVDYIESNLELKRDSAQPKKSPDWCKILTSSQVIAMVIAFFASNWAFAITMLLIPSYLNYILHIPPFKNGVINSVIYIIFCVSSPIVGAVSSFMVQRGAFKLTHLQVRKLFQLTALFGNCGCFIALTLSGCDIDLVLGILYAQIIFYSLTNGGEVQLPAEISLDFAGSIYAIANCVGSATGFLVPRAFSLLVHDVQNRSQWNHYFYLASLVTFVCGIWFMIFGRNDLEDFSKKQPDSPDELPLEYEENNKRRNSNPMARYGTTDKSSKSIQINI